MILVHFSLVERNSSYAFPRFVITCFSASQSAARGLLISANKKCACVCAAFFSEKNRTVVRRKHKELLRSSINDFFVFLSFYPLIINIQIMFDSEKYLARRMRNFFLF